MVTFRPRLWPALLVLLTPAWLAGQSSSSGPHDHQLLAGAWTLDESGPEEKDTNWNRPPRGLPPSSACQPVITPRNADGTYAPAEPCPPMAVRSEDGLQRGREYVVKAFGRELIARSTTLSLTVTSTSVTIHDDLREPTVFDFVHTRKLDVIVSPAAMSPSGRGSTPRAAPIDVKTRWDDQTLLQEFSTRYLNTPFKMTRAFVPGDDGRLFLVIKVLEPKLEPAVKDITRTYIRDRSLSGRASWTS